MRMIWTVMGICAVAASGHGESALRAGEGKTWYKGNTHTHSLWSDGDGAPELAVAWYKEHGYDFLSMTDHNILMRGEKWFPVEADGRLTPERLQALIGQFGEDWVDVRETAGGGQEMRLKTLDELRERFAEETFLLVEGEEITSHVHTNGINLKELIEAPKGDSNVDVLRQQLKAVQEQSEKHGVPMFAHINHPNWGGGIPAEDLAEVAEARFFEVFNGHGGVKNWGDDALHRVSTDKLWDIALALRLSQNPDDILYGVATDDAHNYHRRGAGGSIPGRGWIMVLAGALDAHALVHAILDGDFYASSGVLLDEIAWDDAHFRVLPRQEPGVTYTVQFIGTRKGTDLTPTPVTGEDGAPIENVTHIYSDAVGEVLHETSAVPAVYTFQGDEIYVRAKIVSSKPKVDPFAEGDVEMAWTQPVVRR